MKTLVYLESLIGKLSNLYDEFIKKELDVLKHGSFEAIDKQIAHTQERARAWGRSASYYGADEWRRDPDWMRAEQQAKIINEDAAALNNTYRDIQKLLKFAEAEVLVNYFSFFKEGNQKSLQPFLALMQRYDQLRNNVVNHFNQSQLVERETQGYRATQLLLPLRRDNYSSTNLQFDQGYQELTTSFYTMLRSIQGFVTPFGFDFSDKTAELICQKTVFLLPHALLAIFFGNAELLEACLTDIALTDSEEIRDIIDTHKLLFLALANQSFQCIYLMLRYNANINSKLLLPETDTPISINGQCAHHTPLSFAIKASPTLKRSDARKLLSDLVNAGANYNYKLTIEWAEYRGYMNCNLIRLQKHIRLTDYDKTGLLSEVIDSLKSHRNESASQSTKNNSKPATTLTRRHLSNNEIKSYDTPCRFFKAGDMTSCRYGEDCRFIHGDPAVSSQIDRR